MSESIRTPLGKVRGLGSAKHGAGHFIAQRVSALALIGLVPWFLISLIGAVNGGYDSATQWIAQPVNAILIVIAVATALYHMRLGMQVVIEDYIAKTGTRIFLLLINTFIPVVLFFAAAFAVVKIAG
jgi:succinate dehydrogenase / fumarate reductase membrane anchor subunit